MEAEDQSKPSAAIYAAIYEQAQHPKSKRAVENIKRACDYLSEHKIEISVGEVGRLCNEAGPKTQSLRNNAEFRKYILARRAEQTLTVKPESGPVKFETKDPQANAMIYALQVEARLAEQRVSNLKRALANAGEYDLDAMMKTGKLVRFAQASTSPNGVSPELKTILKRLLDPAHLLKFGLSFKEERVLGFNDWVFLEKDELQHLTVATQNQPQALPPPSKI